MRELAVRYAERDMINENNNNTDDETKSANSTTTIPTTTPTTTAPTTTIPTTTPNTTPNTSVIENENGISMEEVKVKDWSPVVGEFCECFYQPDYLYYPAYVHEIIFGQIARVEFVGYGNIEEVQITWLRAPSISIPSNKNSNCNGNLSTIETNHVVVERDNAKEKLEELEQQLEKVDRKELGEEEKEEVKSKTNNTKKEVKKNKRRNSRNHNNQLKDFEDDEEENPFPNVPDKYWAQRFRYFSKFDTGIQMDDEGWYSVTPEAIAEHIANRCHKNDIIIDCFVGCGGNAIQFAMKCAHVIAIDIDPAKLECARHNAKIYGVEDRIEFILGDALEVVPKLKADIIFLSPPWGGPEYLNNMEFDIETMITSPLDGISLYHMVRKSNRKYYLLSTA